MSFGSHYKRKIQSDMSYANMRVPIENSVGRRCVLSLNIFRSGLVSRLVRRSWFVYNPENVRVDALL